MIQRMMNVQLCEELRPLFKIDKIIRNVAMGDYGINTDRITFLMEQAALVEAKQQYQTQLNEINKSISNMESLIIPTGDMNEAISGIDKKVTELREKSNELTTSINKLVNDLTDNDQIRVMLSQVQHIDITQLKKRQSKLIEMVNTLRASEEEYNGLMVQFNSDSSNLNVLKTDLKRLEDAQSQYDSTVLEIDKHMNEDKRFKVIAEATSSTKGKPVIAIREKVEDALYLTNRLLDVMYDKEIQMLKPVIDETAFTLPFRCGSNISSDIRYGSQSESTLLSLALSLSLASSLTAYNVPLIDEMDAALDAEMRDSFLMMLQEIMSVLKMEQMFIISHSTQPGAYDHAVHVINISEEIANLKE
jgi:DNA repair exonuclease SbcCD ATPase subunit